MQDINCPLAQAAERWPNQVGWMTEDMSCSFKTWHQHVRRTADILRARGWRAGDCIGLEATSAPTLLTIYWALSRIGIAACLVSPRWQTPQIELAANKTKWVDYLTSDAQEQWFRSIPTPSRFPTADAIRRTPDKTMIATILLSSGSMGSPKAIAHTQSAHVINARGANSNVPLAPGDRWLLSLSLAHVGGIGILYRCVLSGATIVLASSKGSLKSQLERWHPSHLSLVPTQLKRILESGIRPWPQLKAVLLGGAPIPGGLMDQAFAAEWPLVTTYGLTEMASQVTATHLRATPAELKTAGRALPDREVQISDEGEILVRGGSLFSGYLDQGLVTPATNKQGWFATRDRGVWDTSGNLLVLGRLDNLFISGGENIYPEEIETELLRLPEIIQALVVPIEDVEYGRRPVVFIDSERWEPELWRQSLRNRLPRFKVPDYFLPWPADIPLKPSRPQMAEFARRELSNFSG